MLAGWHLLFSIDFIIRLAISDKSCGNSGISFLIFSGLPRVSSLPRETGWALRSRGWVRIALQKGALVKDSTGV